MSRDYEDVIDLARAGLRQKPGRILVMTLLVAVTVAGYLVVSSYWQDAAEVSTGTAEPLNFPYIKATWYMRTCPIRR